jgi:tetratricopeptide (TPR) repeat protein
MGLRFRLYSPIRAFLEKENVLGTEFSHVRDAHLNWFLMESTKRGEEIADRADIQEMSWLGEERPNLLAAIAHAATINLSQWAELMRIVIDSDVARAATLALSTLLDDATKDSEDIPLKARARLLTTRAHALRFMGRIEEARSKIDQALILAVESKDADIECAARYTAAWVYWDVNEHEEARAHLDAMEARAPSGDLERWEVRRLFMCCYVEARSGHHTEAKAAGLQAIRLATRRGEPRRVAMLHQRLGAISRDMSDMADAINHTRKAAEIYAQIQDRRNVAYTKNALAMLFAVDHRLDEAGPLLDEARETIEKIGEHHAMALLLGNRGAIHLGLDELAEADQCLWESLQLFDATAIPRGRGFYEAYLGATRALAGRIDKAETLVDAAEATLSEAQFAGLEEFMSAMRALVDVGRARVELKNGHGERAATLLEQAAAQSQPSANTAGVVGFAHHLLARAIEQT